MQKKKWQMLKEKLGLVFTSMKRTLIKDLSLRVGENVAISGWVEVRRDQGKLIFIDLRDYTGIIQSVILPDSEATAIGKEIRSEWVLSAEGIVNKRPEKNINKNVANGDIELEIKKLEVLNKAETPPFDVSTDGREISEETRLTYKYVDLRRERLQKNLRMRSKVAKFIRDYLSNEDFVEVETPLLTKSTPEGARDYIVPSRLYRGQFYALPQSPQQYKQLLMTGGLERYFQIARCMRDEDTRGDRQPEFTQLDLEMSFVRRDDVMEINEKLLIGIVKNLYPEKRIQDVPFPRISYKDALEKYGIDNPDLRKDKNDPNLLSFVWIIDFPFFEKTSDGWTFTHNPFSAAKSEFDEDLLQNRNIGEIISEQYDIVLNGVEIGGGSIRNHKTELLKSVFKILGHEDADIERNFGHMLKAFSLGTPPHGGIAWGFDRLMMQLQNEPNIREVIAFPKTGEGKDPMMNSPSEVKEEQLRELGLEIRKKK